MRVRVCVCACICVLPPTMSNLCILRKKKKKNRLPGAMSTKTSTNGSILSCPTCRKPPSIHVQHSSVGAQVVVIHPHDTVCLNDSRISLSHQSLTNMRQINSNAKTHARMYSHRHSSRHSSRDSHKRSSSSQAKFTDAIHRRNSRSTKSPIVLK